MKTKKIKLSAIEVFTRYIKEATDIQGAFARHYSQTLSENIKRKKLLKRYRLAQKVNK